VLSTAGTSGLRGTFVYDRSAWSVVLANSLRWSRFVGVAPRWPRRVRICTLGADAALHVSRRIPASGNVGLFRMLQLDVTRPLPRLVEALNAFQPEVLMPYPSMAALLAEEQLAGRLHIRPRVVTTHSEVLSPGMAQRIEAAWGTVPFNHYGLTEEPHVGCECGAHSGIHLFEDLCILEVVDERNRPVPPGAARGKVPPDQPLQPGAAADPLRDQRHADPGGRALRLWPAVFPDHRNRWAQRRHPGSAGPARTAGRRAAACSDRPH